LSHYTHNSSPSPSPQTLDIFNLRDGVIDDYRRYIERFLKIRDLRVEEFVDQELERENCGLTPLVQPNPAYKSGSTVTWCSGEFSILSVTVTSPKHGKPFRFTLTRAGVFAAQRWVPCPTADDHGLPKYDLCGADFDDPLRHPEIKGVRAILVTQ